MTGSVVVAILRAHVKLDHPQPRHIGRTVEALRSGGLAVYPTDTTYGFAPFAGEALNNTTTFFVVALYAYFFYRFNG